MPETPKHNDYHLAQFNIARALHDLDDPRMAPFMDALEKVNGLADRMPGFVWRLQDEGGNSTSYRLYDDQRMIVNYTVWTDVKSLKDFVFNTLHKRFLERGKQWFAPDDAPYLVLWRIPAGTIPSVVEARDRLEHLRTHGPSPQGVGWAGLHLLAEARAFPVNIEPF